MAEGRSREQWLHTSAKLWVVAETKRNRKVRSRPFKPTDFNPYERRATGDGSGKKRLTVGVLFAMKGLFQGGQEIPTA